MGNYPAYPAYKASGIEWLGEIPAHWKAVPLKYNLLPKSGAIKAGPFGSQLLASEMNDSVVKVYNQRTVLDRDFELGENYISEEKYQQLKSFEVFPGDFLVTTRGTIGRCAIVPKDAERGILHPCLIRIQLNPGILANSYLHYLVQDAEVVLEQLLIKSNATTIEVIYSETLKSVLLPTPPLPEQEAIARFLDRKTAQIDGLIAKKEALLARLADKRTALISRAVTKGLDPAAPMKDSGVPWLGEIPAHWEVVKLKNVARIQSGLTLGKKYNEETVTKPYLRVANVQDGYLELETITTIELPPREIERYRLQFGDVLMTEGGDFDKLGRGYVWEGQIEDCLHQNHVFAVRPNSSRITPFFLASLTSSFHGKNYFTSSSQQTTNLATINQTKLYNFPIPLPSIKEQEQILYVVKVETERIDLQITTVLQAIDKLKAYRTALITHGVTGKIDVRGLA